MDDEIKEIGKSLFPTAGMKPVAIPSPPEEYLMTGGGGKSPSRPALVLENICRVIKRDEKLSSCFRLNDFSHMVESSYGGTEWINLQDAVILKVLRYISTQYSPFLRLSKEMLTDAIRSIAEDHKVNPPKDYLTFLVWDKTPRLDTWLHVVYGSPNDELHCSIGSNWLKGLVKRVISPGCQFDEVLTLIGAQGWKKSVSLRELGKPWHVESTMSAEDKDFYILLAQNIIVEFSEGDVFKRTDLTKLKAIITKTEDQYRPPYERGMGTFKRGCVFAMTINNTDFLKDETGNRRWLPVTLGKIADVEWIKQNRDQLFAEAYYRLVELKETTWEYPKELEELQMMHMETSGYDEEVTQWYLELSKHKKEEGISLIEVFKGVFNKISEPPKEMSKADEWRIGGILRRVLFLDNPAARVKGKLSRRWIPTQKTRENFDLSTEMTEF